jgi:hypothetical protein
LVLISVEQFNEPAKNSDKTTRLGNRVEKHSHTLKKLGGR